MSWFLERWIDERLPLARWLRERPRRPFKKRKPTRREAKRFTEAFIAELHRMGHTHTPSLHLERNHRTGRLRPGVVRAWTIGNMADRARTVYPMHGFSRVYNVWLRDKDRDGVLLRFDDLTYHRDYPAAALIVTCPSKKTTHVLCVPPTMRTVREARAWTFGLDADAFNPAVET